MPKNQRKEKFSTSIKPEPEVPGPHLVGRIWFEHDDLTLMSWSKATMIELIDELGSISAAARSMKFSYAKAWRMVQELNRMGREPMVINKTGGKAGGGAMVTEEARDHARRFKELCAEFAAWLSQHSNRI